MTEIKGSVFPPKTVATKCLSHYDTVKKKKKIDLNATGDPKTNNLLFLLQCQSKATKECKEKEEDYSLCHKSFMGVGSYKGKRHCGEEMEALYHCIISLGSST
jgi:hypothetical protein